VTFFRGSRGSRGVDLKPVPEVVSDRVWKAMIDASKALDALGVKHALVYLKLVSPRAKDRLDVIELVRSGIDLPRVRAYLEAHAPQLREKLEQLVAVAEQEEGS
jgi:hypothetical protein